MYYVYNISSYARICLGSVPVMFDNYREAKNFVQNLDYDYKWKPILQSTFEKIVPCVEILAETGESWMLDLYYNNFSNVSGMQTFIRRHQEKSKNGRAIMYGLSCLNNILGVAGTPTAHYELTYPIVDFPWIVPNKQIIENNLFGSSWTTPGALYTEPKNLYKNCCIIKFEVTWIKTRRDVVERDLLLYTNSDKLLDEGVINDLSF